MSKKYTKNPYDQSNFTVNPILTKFCHYNQKGFLEGSCKFWFIIWNFFLKNLFQIFQLSGIFFCENNLECCSKEKLFFGIKTYFFKKTSSWSLPTWLWTRQSPSVSWANPPHLDRKGSKKPVQTGLPLLSGSHWDKYYKTYCYAIAKKL